jgi:hypothetical protein
LELGRRNAELNGVDVEFVKADVKAFMAEAAEGVRNAGRHVDGKITALADDIDALGKALRAVAEAAAKDASDREVKRSLILGRDAGLPWLC